MYRAPFAALALAAALASGCAGPKFYTLENGKENETGIPIYPPKIFLVVSYTGAKDHPVEVTLVRVPDRGADPIYARELRGWGSGELSLDFDGVDHATHAGQLSNILLSLLPLIMPINTAS
jgi:hypothetical protein